MWLKPAIVVLFIGILISLGASAIFLLIDKGEKDRTRKTLGVRVIMAILLIACVVYGIATGQLFISAPWQ